MSKHNSWSNDRMIQKSLGEKKAALIPVEKKSKIVN